jgi:DNA-binding response OmpR family regulator
MKTSKNKKHILLIEDDPFLIDIYTQKFQKEGFVVQTAPSGEKAFELIKNKVPDLILLDIVLPGIDGWNILKTIKAAPSLSQCKIIILSNLSQKSEIEKGLKLGATQYLIKSQYTPLQVVEEIKKFFPK